MRSEAWLWQQTQRFEALLVRSPKIETFLFSCRVCSFFPIEKYSFLHTVLWDVLFTSKSILLALWGVDAPWTVNYPPQIFRRLTGPAWLLQWCFGSQRPPRPAPRAVTSVCERLPLMGWWCVRGHDVKIWDVLWTLNQPGAPVFSFICLIWDSENMFVRKTKLNMQF